MRRILEVFGEPISRGGQESYVYNTLKHMDLSDFQIDLFTPYYCDNERYQKFIEGINGKIITGNVSFKVGGSRREIIPVFKQHLDQNKYDIIHIHSGSTSVLAYYSKYAYLSGAKKVIVHSHSSGEKENIKHWLIKRYSTLYFNKYVTDFCACSKEAAIWKFPKSKINNTLILKNGVDLNLFQFRQDERIEMRNLFNIDSKTLVLGSVGRFTKEKNQIFLVNLMADYVKINSNVILVLVGDGDEKSNVQERVKSLHLENNVIFAGSRDNVYDFMQMFDIFLFPSLYEGLGIVAIEAQATGLPVIASEGVPKDIKITDTVKFQNLDDHKGWLECISSFMNAERINQSNLVKKNGFDILDTAKNIYEMYEVL